ncbi:hypothetical protein Tco_0540386 [Tanacetum coccineum]
MYEHYFKSFNADTKSRLKKSSAPLVGFSGEIYHPLGLIDLRVTMGEPRKKKSVLLEFSIVRYRSPNNVNLGRTGMRSLRAIGSTIHSMIKFPMANGHMEHMSRVREHAILRNRSISGRRLEKYPMVSKGTALGKYTWITRALTKSAKDKYHFLENDEEKMGFHTEEGVYCFTHKPKGLKNYGATLQRVMDKVLRKQNGQNVEVYLEEVVMKSKSE